MRKLERRAIMCLMLTAVLFIGLLVFSYRFVTHGEEWAGFYGNTQIYTDGVVNRGSVYDRNGQLLIDCTKDGLVYPDDATMRKATVHAVGDPSGSISEGAINKFGAQLIGYDLLNGTYDTSKDGKKITLTIDAEANRAAYEGLSGYDGVVAVMNYATGEIMCLVSTPSFDPQEGAPDDPESPVFFNPFYQGTLTPGSTFKLVTSAAAIDNLPDLQDFRFSCDGTNTFQGVDFTCVEVHGADQTFEEALANSCNGAFGELTREIGADTMDQYVDKLGLTGSLNVNGIKTAKGSFSFPPNDDIALSWAGIGQGEDLVNPCTMLVYVASIANGGEAVQPSIIKESNFLGKLTSGQSLGQYLDPSTADELRAMMKNNVETSYGAGNFDGLDIYAKSGTAEVGTDEDNAWFVGFIDNPDHPYAFLCWVKGGGSGSRVAGPIAKAALYELIENN